MSFVHWYYFIHYVFEFQCLDLDRWESDTTQSLDARAATASAMNIPLANSSGLCARSSFSGCDRIHEMSLGSSISDIFIVMSLVSSFAARNGYPPEIRIPAVTLDWVL
jgi:hypothetical protein